MGTLNMLLRKSCNLFEIYAVMEDVRELMKAESCNALSKVDCQPPYETVLLTVIDVAAL